MASNSETIYIKAGRNTEVKKPDITLGEVLEITCVIHQWKQKSGLFAC